MRFLLFAALLVAALPTAALEVKGVTIGKKYDDSQLREIFGHASCETYTTGSSKCEVPTTLFGRDAFLNIHRNALGNVAGIGTYIPKWKKTDTIRMLQDRFGPYVMPKDHPSKCALWNHADNNTGQISACDFSADATYIWFHRSEALDPNDI